MNESALTCSPYPPVGSPGFDPGWRTEVVVALARGVDAAAAFDRLPILADALEEAGCDLPALLDHCRRCPRHHPQCWAVGLVLDRPAASPAAPPSDPDLFRPVGHRPAVRYAPPNGSTRGSNGCGGFFLFAVVAFGALRGLVGLLSPSPSSPPLLPPVLPPNHPPRIDPAFRLPSPPPTRPRLLGLDANPADTAGRAWRGRLPAPPGTPDTRPLVIPPQTGPPKQP
jgi:hypothetical protein